MTAPSRDSDDQPGAALADAPKAAALTAPSACPAQAAVLSRARATPADVMAIQRAAGNRAAGRFLTRKHLMSPKEFHQATKGGKRDGTIKQIEERLKRWEKLDAHRQSKESNDFDRVSTAELLAVDAETWLADHPADTSALKDTVEEVRAAARRDADRLRHKAVKRWGREADTRMQRRIAAKDAHSAFQSLAGVLDLAVPTPGSKAEVEGEIELALDPNMVGFVGCRVKLEADRPEASKLKARAELSFTAGAKFANVGRIRVELGGYLEAQAQTGKELMQLVSYALYRGLRGTHDVPRWFLNKAWGGAFDSDPGYRNAERWAGSVETSVLAPSDAYVEAGWLAGVMGEAGFMAGAVGAKAKGQLQIGSGERWDKKSITTIQQEKSRWSEQKIADLTELIAAQRRRGDKIDPHAAYSILAGAGLAISVHKLEGILKRVEKLDGSSADLVAKVENIVRDASPTGTRPKLGEASKPEPLFGAQASRAERTFWVKGSAELDVTIATMGVKFEANYQTRGRDRAVPTHLREAKVEGKFGVKLPVNRALGDGLLSALEIGKAVNVMLGFCRTINTVADDKDLGKKSKAWRGAGSGLRAGGDLAPVLTQLKDVAGEPFKFGHGGKVPDALKPGASGFVSLMVVIDAKWKPGHSDGSKDSYEVNLHVAEEQGFKYEADLAAVAGRISAKTQDRWLRINIKDGVWKIDWLGKTYDKKKP